jgi:hypothetical protein
MTIDAPEEVLTRIYILSAATTDVEETYSELDTIHCVCVCVSEWVSDRYNTIQFMVMYVCDLTMCVSFSHHGSIHVLPQIATVGTNCRLKDKGVT